MVTTSHATGLEKTLLETYYSDIYFHKNNGKNSGVIGPKYPQYGKNAFAGYLKM